MANLLKIIDDGRNKRFQLFDYEHVVENFYDSLPNDFNIKIDENFSIITPTMLTDLYKLTNDIVLCDWEDLKSWKFIPKQNILINFDNLHDFENIDNFDNVIKQLHDNIFPNMWNCVQEQKQFYLFSSFSKSRVPTFYTAFLMYSCKKRGLEADLKSFHDFVFADKPFDLRISHYSFLFNFYEFLKKKTI